MRSAGLLRKAWRSAHQLTTARRCMLMSRSRKSLANTPFSLTTSHAK